MAAIDKIAPGQEAVAVTPSDATTYPTPFRALYVGGAGNVAIKCFVGATAVTFVGVPAGGYVLAEAYQVMSTNTTATSIVGLK